jgi:hypothetical protein
VIEAPSLLGDPGPLGVCPLSLDRFAGASDIGACLHPLGLVRVTELAFGGGVLLVEVGGFLVSVGCLLVRENGVLVSLEGPLAEPPRIFCLIRFRHSDKYAPAGVSETAARGPDKHQAVRSAQHGRWTA